jgi:hypothetical protein
LPLLPALHHHKKQEKFMNDVATTESVPLRQRWQLQRQRVREMMDGHIHAAMTAASGKMHPATRIFGDRLATDTELKREMDILTDLATQLGLLPPGGSQPQRRKRATRRSAQNRQRPLP